VVPSDGPKTKCNNESNYQTNGQTNHNPNLFVVVVAVVVVVGLEEAGSCFDVITFPFS